MSRRWARVRLGDVAEVQSGGTPTVSVKENWSGNVPWYSSGELGPPLTADSIRKISLAGLDASNAKLFPAGSLLIGMYDTAALKMSVLDRPAAFNQAIAGVRPNDRVDMRFVRYSIEFEKAALLAQRRGVRQKNLSLEKIKNIQLPCPPLVEQKVVVAKLDDAFEGIAAAKVNAEKNLQNARELFESRREELLAPDGAGWLEAPLADLCTIKHGYAFEGEFFSTTGEHVLLTPGNFFESGGYRDRGEKQKYYTGEIPADYVLAEGNLLVAMTEQAAGLLGSPMLVPEANRFLHNQRLGLVIANPGASWCNDYFFHVFNLRRVRAEIHTSASGVKVRHTSPTKIGDVRVAYPQSRQDQLRIAAALSAFASECDTLAEIAHRKLAALDELKKSLLHQAFSGTLTARKSNQLLTAAT